MPPEHLTFDVRGDGSRMLRRVRVSDLNEAGLTAYAQLLDGYFGDDLEARIAGLWGLIRHVLPDASPADRAYLATRVDRVNALMATLELPTTPTDTSPKTIPSHLH